MLWVTDQGFVPINKIQYVYRFSDDNLFRMQIYLISGQKIAYTYEGEKQRDKDYDKLFKALNEATDA